MNDDQTEIVTVAVTTYSVGDVVLRKRDGKLGQIEKVISAATSADGVSSGRFLVNFLEPDCDTDLHGEELRPVTDEEIIRWLALRFEEDVKFEEEYMRKREEVQNQNLLIEAGKLANIDYYNSRIDKYKDGEFRDSFATILNNGVHNLEYTEADARPLAERILGNLHTLIEKSGEDDKGFPEFPFFTGSLADLASALAPDLPWEFKFASAMTFWGLIRSGLDTLESEPYLQPRFYTALVADPGRGKSAAIKEVRSIFARISSRFSRCSSVDSGPALVDEFHEQSEQMKKALFGDRAAILLDPDELSDLFEKSKSSRQSRNTIAGELLKLFEGNITANHARSTGKGKIEIENAHLAIIGGATTDGYPTLWTGTGGGANGLQSRFTIVASHVSKLPSQQQPTDAEKLAAVILRLCDQAARPGQRFKISDEASRRLKIWWNSTPRDKASEIRIADLVKRILIILASTNDADEIDIKLMEQAIAFGNYQIAVREQLNPMDSHSWVQGFENAILQVFQRSGEALTYNDVRRLIHPERKPGGVGVFFQAFQNLARSGMLDVEKTAQGIQRFRLAKSK